MFFYEQIEALIAMSDVCEQEIKFEVFSLNVLICRNIVAFYIQIINHNKKFFMFSTRLAAHMLLLQIVGI